MLLSVAGQSHTLTHCQYVSKVGCSANVIKGFHWSYGLLFRMLAHDRALLLVPEDDWNSLIVVVVIVVVVVVVAEQ